MCLLPHKRAKSRATRDSVGAHRVQVHLPAAAGVLRRVQGVWLALLQGRGVVPRGGVVPGRCGVVAMVEGGRLGLGFPDGVGGGVVGGGGPGRGGVVGGGSGGVGCCKCRPLKGKQ